MFKYFLNFLRRKLWVLWHPKDRCESCKGTKGGIYGNENVNKNGRILCDYCS